jgi:hypothetical protein
MSRGFIRWPATVLGVLLAAVVINGEISRLSAESFDRGTKEFGVDALDEFESPSGSPTPMATSSLDPSASPSPSTSGAATPTPTAGGGGNGGGAGGFAWNTPETGVYTYSVSGQEDVNIAGPACRRRYGSGRMTVGPYEGLVQMDLEYINADGSNTHSERRHYQYSETGVRVVYTHVGIFCIRQENDPATYDPPLLLFEFPLEVGNVWTSHSESEERTNDLTAEVLRTETITAAGRTFDTFVIKTLITFTGDQEGIRSQTWWFDPVVGVSVKWQEETEARQGPATFRQNATWVLTGLP